MLNKTAQQIVATVVYYDVMDYPMTAFEIWKYLIQIGENSNENDAFLFAKEDSSLAGIITELENDEMRKRISHKNGYYFLTGRDELVAKRIFRNKIAENKIKTVRHIVRFLRFVPYVRMVAVAGSLAVKNTEKRSDLDLLIGIKHGKIFTGRLLVTAVVHLLGKRRYGKKITNRICLNHFITTKFSISAKDIFSSHEYVFLKPLFDDDFFLNFQENNKWIKEYRPNFFATIDNIYLVKDSYASRLVRKTGEKMLKTRYIEDVLKRWQKNRIEKNPQSKKIGSFIVCSDEELAFWLNFEKQGPLVFEKFQEKMQALKKDKDCKY